jgi:hypothetical protein
LNLELEAKRLRDPVKRRQIGAHTTRFEPRYSGLLAAETFGELVLCDAGLLSGATDVLAEPPRIFGRRVGTGHTKNVINEEAS